MVVSAVVNFTSSDGRFYSVTIGARIARAAGALTLEDTTVAQWFQPPKKLSKNQKIDFRFRCFDYVRFIQRALVYTDTKKTVPQIELPILHANAKAQFVEHLFFFFIFRSLISESDNK